MPCKWCGGTCKDMDDHCRKAKIAKYHATHEKRITWGKEYTAPLESFGTWIEIKMVEDEWESGIWHERWDFNKSLKSHIANAIMKELGNTLRILSDEDYGHSYPYLIQVDDKGYCHLLSARVHGEPKSTDMILRIGVMEWVKVE